MADTATKEAEVKKKSIAELLKEDGQGVEDPELAAVVTEDGKVVADLGMPESFMVDIAAAQMVDHMVAYEQARQAWRAARGQGNGQRAEQLYQQMRFSELTVALIQRQHPGAKVLANEMMQVRAAEARARRKAILDT